MPAVLERDERPSVARAARRWQIAPIHRAFRVRRSEDSGVRRQRVEHLWVAAVAPLASDIVSRVWGTIPGFEVVLAGRVRAGVVAVSTGALRRDLR